MILTSAYSIVSNIRVFNWAPLIDTVKAVVQSVLISPIEFLKQAHNFVGTPL